MADLLEQYDELPQDVQNVLNYFFHLDNTYENCEWLVETLNKIGYTIEYGLDAEPYNLRKL